MDFIKQNKKDIFYIVLLFTILFAIVIFRLPYFGDCLTDSGREFMFAEAMTDGKLLYRDLFNIFGPLSYQLNSLVFSIFGVSFNSLRIFGAINACFIFSLIYLILRLFTTHNKSFIITFSLMIFNLYCCSVGAFPSPYTYAMLYALEFFLFSLYFLLLTIKKENKKYIIPCWFFAGVSIASKYEIIFYLVFLVFFTLLIVKPDRKTLLLSIISFLSVPALCFSALFLQGLTIKEFLNQMHYVFKYASSDALTQYYINDSGIYLNLKVFPERLALMLKQASFFIAVFIAYIVLFFKPVKNKKYNLIKIAILFAIISNFKPKMVNYGLFVFFTIPMLAICLYCWGKICYEVIKKIEFDKTFFLFLILLTSVCLISTKTVFYLCIHSYGAFIFPLLFICLFIFISEILPDELKLNKNLLTSAFILTTLLSLFLFLECEPKYYAGSMKFFETPRGTIAYPPRRDAIADVLRYTLSYIGKDKTILFVPEGCILNFATERKGSLFWYNSTSPYLEAFGDEKFINDIKSENFDYIVLSDHKTNFKTFDEYAPDVVKYIKNNYKPIQVFEDPTDCSKSEDDILVMTLYERK